MSVEINATNFPDAGFRQFVSDNYDLDHDGVLSASEIEAVTSMTINNLQGLTFLHSDTYNLAFFTYLETLTISNCSDLRNVMLIDLPALRTVSINNCQSLESFTAGIKRRVPNLQSISIQNCQALDTVKYWGASEGSYLSNNNDTYHSNLTSFTLSNCPNITILECICSSITGINLAGLNKLTQLDLRCSLIQTVNLIDCVSLSLFYCWNGSLSSVIFGNLGNIKSILVQRNSLTQLDIGTAPLLKFLEIYGNNISVIDIGGCPLIVSQTNRQPDENNVLFDYRNESPIKIHASASMAYPEISFDGSTLVKATLLDIAIITHPESQTIEEGETVLLSVLASGSDLHYRWEVKQKGENAWTIITNSNSNQYSLTASANDDGSMYQCAIYNSGGTIYSNVAIITVLTSPSIVTQPQNVSTVEGSNISFSVEASGNNIAYQWQVSTDGTTYNDIRYANESTYELVASLPMSGNKYRCVITNEVGSISSNPATLNVTADPSLVLPVITSHPSAQEVSEGENATFSVSVEGNNLSYQWQTLYNGVWYNINGATDSSYAITANTTLNGNQYRCQVSNFAGTVYSNIATLTVRTSGSNISTPIIKMQPRSVNVNIGQTATFTVHAEGGSLSYQWQVKREEQWYRIANGETNVYSVVARAIDNGIQYRCLVMNSAGSVYSNVVTLNVQAPAPVNFYGYHSIIISGKNTYGEWEMYPTSRPHVAPPEVKTSYVDVPGADGGLDYTDLLTGKPRFGYRKGSWEFLLVPQERWPEVYRSLCNFLNGKIHTVILEDDPTWQYTGRLRVNKWESAAHNSLITIDYILDPNPINLDDESYSTDDEDLAAAARILRKPGNDGMVIGMFNGLATVVDPTIYFEDGDSISY